MNIYVLFNKIGCTGNVSDPQADRWLHCILVLENGAI
jgi:hypothetical protein